MKEKEIVQIVELISHDAKFEISLFEGILKISFNDIKNKYEVMYDPDLSDGIRPDFFKMFDDPIEAANEFVSLRYKYQIGNDFDNMLI